MNRRDGMIIFKNKFKFSDSESKDFDEEIANVAKQMSIDSPQAMLHCIIGGRFFMTLLTMLQTKKNDEVNIEVKEVESDFYFESLKNLKQNDNQDIH